MDTLTLRLAPGLAEALSQAAADEELPGPAALVERIVEDWREARADNIEWLRERIREADEDPRPDVSLEEVCDHITLTIERVARERA